jgi:hypothetical protein
MPLIIISRHKPIANGDIRRGKRGRTGELLLRARRQQVAGGEGDEGDPD